MQKTHDLQQPRVLGLSTGTAPQPSVSEYNSANSGTSQVQIQSLVDQTLQRYIASGAFTGPQGPQGPPGPSGLTPGFSGPNGMVQNGNGQTTSVIGGTPIISYIPAVPANNFPGTSLAGFGSLSAGTFASGNTTISGNLNVSGPISATGAVTVGGLISSGDATISGTLSAATSTLASLVVSGPATFTGSTTIAGLNVTGFNPGLTPGSIAFQGSSALVQDNANLFYDSADHRLGLGTTTPSQLLTVAGNGLFAGQLTVTGPAVLGTSTIANLTLGTALPVSSGGTGSTSSPFAGAIAYGTGSAYAFSAAGTANQVLASGGTGAPTFSNIASLLTQGSNIQVSGTSTIAVSANPTFTSINVSAASTLGTASSSALTVSGPLFVTDISTLATTSITSLTVNGNSLFGTNSGDVTLTGQNYLSLSGQQITASPINLNSGNVTNILPVLNGGTGSTSSPFAGAIAYGTGSAYAFSAAGTANQVLASGGTGAPTFSNIASLLTQGSNIQVSGTSTLAVVSSPSFVTLTVSGTSSMASLTITGNVGIGTMVLASGFIAPTVDGSSVFKIWNADHTGSPFFEVGTDWVPAPISELFVGKVGGGNAGVRVADHLWITGGQTDPQYWIDSVHMVGIYTDEGPLDGNSEMLAMLNTSSHQDFFDIKDAAGNGKFSQSTTRLALTAGGILSLGARGSSTVPALMPTGSDLEIVRGNGTTPANLYLTGTVGVGIAPTTQPLEISGGLGYGGPIHINRAATGAVNGNVWGISLDNSAANDGLFLGQSSSHYSTGGALPWIGNSNAYLYYPTTFNIGTGTGVTPTAVFSSTGNVGIGTTTVNSRLVIQGSGITSATAAETTYNASGTLLTTILNNGNVGIGTTSPQYLLQVGSASVASGTVARFQNANGTCDINPTTNTLSCSSDARLKKNITPMTDDLSQVMALQPVYFNWNAESAGTPEHSGFIAQQVQQIIPEVVSTDPATGLLSLGYSGLVPAMVGAMQQMQTEITTLQGGLTGNATTSNLIVYEPSNFSGDSVGEAQIPAGSISVSITFSQPYAYQPIVTITAEDQAVVGFVKDKTATGFTISLASPALSDITFDWHSFASPAEQLTVSDGTASPILLVVASGPSTDPSGPGQGSIAPAPEDEDARSTPSSGQVLGDATTTPDFGTSTMTSSGGSSTPDSNANASGSPPSADQSSAAQGQAYGTPNPPSGSSTTPSLPATVVPLTQPTLAPSTSSATGDDSSSETASPPSEASSAAGGSPTPPPANTAATPPVNSAAGSTSQ